MLGVFSRHTSRGGGGGEATDQGDFSNEKLKKIVSCETAIDRRNLGRCLEVLELRMRQCILDKKIYTRVYYNLKKSNRGRYQHP